MSDASTTVITVGHRIRIECGPAQRNHPGRLWALYFDNERVEGLVDVYLFGSCNDLGQRVALFLRDIEPNPDAIVELRRHGWTASVIDNPPEGMQAGVFDKNGHIVRYAAGAHEPEATQAVARQAAHAAFWWHGDHDEPTDRDLRWHGNGEGL